MDSLAANRMSHPRIAPSLAAAADANPTAGLRDVLSGFAANVRLGK